MNKKLTIDIKRRKMFRKILKILLLNVVLFFCNYTSSQQSKNEFYRTKYKQLFYTQPDSSYYYIKRLKQGIYKDHDTIKAKDYNNFSFYFLYSNQKDSAIYYLEQSLKFTSPVNKPKTLMSLGLFYKKLGDYNKAIKIYDSVTKFDNTSFALKGMAYSEMASTYSLKVDFKKSKYFFLKALAISKKAKDSATANIIKINFGEFYIKNNLPELALPLFNESIDYYENKENWRNYFIAILNITNCYVMLDNLEAALLQINTIDIEKIKRLDDKWLLASYFNNKAHLFRLLNVKNVNIDSMYIKSLQYAQDSKDTQFMGYYNKYLDYLVDGNYVDKINQSLIDYKLDSVSKVSNLIDKIQFLSIVGNAKFHIEFNNYNKEELYKFKDSLYSMTSTTTKEELLLNRSKLKNATNQQKELEFTQKTLMYLLLALFVGFVFTVFKNRTSIKHILTNSKQRINDIEKTNQANSLDLKKEIIDLNLTNTLQEEKLTEYQTIARGSGISSELLNNKYWDKFRQKLKTLDPEFMNLLKSKHPDFTATELDLLMFIKLNMSNKEIAELFQMGYRSLIVKKQRLKKKLGLPKELNLEDYIYHILEA